MDNPRLRPFIRYYGGKYRSAPRYPKPVHHTIIEPFAGAAGYSLRYYYYNVILVEIYDVLYSMWKYLINATYREIMNIPLVEHIDDLPNSVCQEARYLVGFRFNDASVAPTNQLSAGKIKLASMGRRFEGWNKNTREMVANQVKFIKHWTVKYGDYSVSPDMCATWFIDPPYQKQGKFYKHSSIDYSKLSRWCLSRTGQIIVCEQVGADWLPFQKFIIAKSGPMTRKSEEAIYYIETM